MINSGETLTINIKYEEITRNLKIIKDYTVKQIISLYINIFINSNYDVSKYTLMLKEKAINHEETLLPYLKDINNNCIFDLIFGNMNSECVVKDDNEKEIDIKFFKKNKNIFHKYNFQNLLGLLKLCLLKEIAITEEFKYINKLPEKISKIMELLKNVKTESNESIFETLNKTKDGNIINFAKFVDGIISQNEINTYLIPGLSQSRNDILYL